MITLCLVVLKSFTMGGEGLEELLPVMIRVSASGPKRTFSKLLGLKWGVRFELG